MKRDGHTHTQFCMHASGEPTEEYLIRAIQLGFDTYSVTEHLPYPEKFLQAIPYTAEIQDSLRVRGGDFDSYIREMQKLKQKYKDKIRVLVGSEIDYLPEETSHTKQMLREYGPYLEDSLLSVHFISGASGWRAVDQNPQDYEEGLLSYYTGFAEAQLAYFRAVATALKEDLGPYKPRRISHLTLCNKFQRCFNSDGNLDGRVEKVVISLLEYMHLNGYELDVNAAGLYKPYCGEIYPSPWIIRRAAGLKIPLVYGSDAHAVKDVGRGYSVYEDLVINNTTPA